MVSDVGKKVIGWATRYNFRLIPPRSEKKGLKDRQMVSKMIL